MKIVVCFFVSIMVLLSTNRCTSAQNNTEHQQAIQMLKEFYSAYSTIKFTIKDIRRIDSLQRKYCTIKLRSELQKEFETNGLDHDLLTNDYGIDTDALKTISIVKDSRKANAYTASWVISSRDPSFKPIKEKVILHVFVVKEGGQLKIDSVQ